MKRIKHEQWDRLVELVPSLLELRERAQSYRPHEGFCANEVWYGPAGIRRQVIESVGGACHHPDPWVHSGEAYDIAYHTLYNLLPDCDHEETMCRRGIGY